MPLEWNPDLDLWTDDEVQPTQPLAKSSGELQGSLSYFWPPKAAF
jgi:hypothetical protein